MSTGRVATVAVLLVLCVGSAGAATALVANEPIGVAQTAANEPAEGTLSFDETTVEAGSGERISLAVRYDTSTGSAGPGAYGAQFRVDYPTEYLDLTDDASGPYLEGDGTGTLIFANDTDEAAGTFDYGITSREDTEGVTGAGDVVYLTFEVTDLPVEEADPTITFSGVNVSDPAGDPVATATEGVDLALNRAPEPAFSVNDTTPTVGAPVEFDASGSTDDGSIAAYEWDLDGDGTFDDATGATVTERYASTGDRAVGLRVTDDEGESATETETVSVERDIVPLSITANRTDAEIGERIRFNITAADGTERVAATVTVDGTPIDDGPVETTVFEPQQTGTVEVVASKENTSTKGYVNDSLTLSISQEQNDPPQAALTVDPATAETGETITLDASGSTDPNGDTLSYSWDLNDDGSFDDASGATIQKSYDSAGNRVVAVRVSDGESSTLAEQTVEVRVAPPEASFTVSPSSAKTGETVTFDASGSSTPDGTIDSYQWDLNDDGSFEASGVEVTRSYPSAGDRIVTLRVSNGQSSDTAERTVTVTANRAPEASLTVSPSSANVDETVTFDASGSSDPDGDALSYRWDLDGDGAFDDAFTPTVERGYASAGDRTVTVQVTDGQSSDTAERTVTVTANRAPEASLAVSPSPVDVGETVTLDASNSTDPDGDTLSYSWDLDGDNGFGDATGATVTTSYSSTGDRSVSVRVTDDGDVSDVATQTVSVVDLATAVELRPSEAVVDEGSDVTLDVVLDGADGGVGAYNLNVSVNDSSTANVTGVELAETSPDAALTDVEFGPGGSYVSVDTGGVTGVTGDGEVTFLNVTLAGKSAGSVELDLAVNTVGNTSGESYTVSAARGATLTVDGGPGPVGNFDSAPSDPDGDGAYEDVNGDGAADVVDVRALFVNRDGDTVGTDPGAFDYNGDGEFDVVDVRALFVELTS